MRLFTLLPIALPLLAIACTQNTSLTEDPSGSSEHASTAGADGQSNDGANANADTIGDDANAPSTTPKQTTPPATTPPVTTPQVTPPAPDAPGPAPTLSVTGTPNTYGFVKLNTGTVDYLVHLPKGYVATKAYPMLVGAHGCGDTAENFAQWAVAPPKTRSNLPYIAVSVGGREGTCWNTATDSALLDSVIAHVRQRVYAHDKKIFVGGFSSGGELAYKYGMTHAGALAGIIIENSGMYEAFGASNVAAALQAAARKINVAHTANRSDTTFPLTSVQADWTKMTAAKFPLTSKVQEGTHDGTADTWEDLVTHVTQWSR